MSIVKYISEKKAKFQGKIETIRSQRADAKALKLKELEKENKILNERLQIDRQLNVVQEKQKSLKREQFGNTFAGKVANKIKAKTIEDRKKNMKMLGQNKEGNIFTQQATYSNPFSSPGLSNPFSHQHKKRK